MMQRNKSLGLLLALAAMGAMTTESRGRAFYPNEPTDKQKRQQAKDASQINQLRRFVIRGQEVWARNKKDALKQVNK